MTDRDPPRARPLSAVAQAPALIGLAAALLGLLWLRQLGVTNRVTVLVLMMGLYSLPNLIAEYLRLPHDVADARRNAEGALPRCVVKLAALAAVTAVMAAGYASLPVYQEGLLDPLLGVLNRIGLAALIIAPVYVYVTDQRMAEPRDGCYMAGLCVIGRWRAADLGMAWQFVLGWLVKAFFLPLMISFAGNDMGWILTLDFTQTFADGYGWYEFFYRFFFFVDVFVACSGYLLTLKLFDSHIRSTEPTTGGWAVALVCYPPFWNMIEQSYLRYEDDYFWGEWLAPYPVLKLVWALAILGCVFVYVWATVSFGIRFSNLTNRGILTNGPYALVKHPAYLSKNISWWLVSVPFVGTASPAMTVVHCVSLAVVNLIYYARAKTEERHLMRDPAYLAYAQWIAENGLFARLRQIVRQAGAVPAR